MKKKSSRYTQLTLFPTLIPPHRQENLELWESVESLKLSHDSVRKKLFSELQEMKSIIQRLEDQQYSLFHRVKELDEYVVYEDQRKAL